MPLMRHTDGRCCLAAAMLLLMMLLPPFSRQRAAAARFLRLPFAAAAVVMLRRRYCLCNDCLIRELHFACCDYSLFFFAALMLILPSLRYADVFFDAAAIAAADAAMLRAFFSLTKHAAAFAMICVDARHRYARNDILRHFSFAADDDVFILLLIDAFIADFLADYSAD